MTDRPRYIVELEAVPGDDREPVRRLRGLLKVALRQFGLRCVSMRAVKPEPEKKPQRTKTGSW